jgi:hypothetical protein
MTDEPQGYSAEMDAKIAWIIRDPEGYYAQAYAEARRLVQVADDQRLLRLMLGPRRALQGLLQRLRSL